MKKTSSFLFRCAFCILVPIAIGMVLSGCGIYSFSEVNTKLDGVSTVNLHIFENNAPYVNPQLVPNLNDRLKQKITRQTKLTQTNRDNADLDISGSIRDYSVLTTGISSANGQSQTSINRLTVAVHVVINNQRNQDVKEVDVSRSFDFPASQSLNQAEAQLLDEMVRNLTDDIFNRIFSDW
jgi:outer membrane lipopolysaccharide assembly protein LptE/RlpB